MTQPDLLYSVLCDEVRREDNGKWILLGLFEDLMVPSLPFQIGRCCIVNKWCNGEGKHAQQLRMVDETGRVIAQSDMVPFELADQDANFVAVQIFVNLPVERVGKIYFEVLLDGELKQRYSMRVALVPATAPQ